MVTVSAIVLTLVVAAGSAAPRAVGEPGSASASPPKAGGVTPPTEDAPSKHAEVSLLAMPRTFTPGEPFVLGVEFKMKPGWHIYWNGINDSGLVPEIKLDLPAGWTASEPRWPAPARHLSAGDILDHVFEGTVVSRIVVTPAADGVVTRTSTTDTAAKIRAKVDYLICEEACVPEEADVQITLAKVARSAVDPRVAQPGKEPRVADGSPLTDPTNWPQPWPERGLTVKWERTTLVITSTDFGDRLEFYPQNGSPVPRNLIDDGVSDNGTLRVDFLGPRPGASRVVRGIIRVSARPAERQVDATPGQGRPGSRCFEFEGQMPPSK